MAKNEAPPSFAEVIEKAQELPRRPAGSAPAEVSSPFEMPIPPDHRVVDDVANPNKIPGLAEYDYSNHVEYFVIPRDEEKYQAVRDKIAAGEAILAWEERTFDKEGQFLIVTCYMTRRVNQAAAARRRREDEAEKRGEADNT